jgi:hypothetical protein
MSYILTCFSQVRPRFECNDTRVVCWVWQIWHVPVYDNRLKMKSGVMWMRRTNWRSCKQRHRFFLFKRINMWYHDAFYYFLSIYVRFGQFIIGPVNMYLGQMACKFQIPKSLTVIVVYLRWRGKSLIFVNTSASNYLKNNKI